MAQGRETPPSAGAELPIVAFDFDGTMTVEDSFSAFLKWRAGRAGWAKGCVRLLPKGLSYLVHRDRGRIKADAVHEFLKGVPRAELEADAEAFARLRFETLMRPDAVAAFRNWKDKPVRLGIVTASPDIVVRPFAERMEADFLLGTIFSFDPENRVLGAFTGPNCRGPEKTVRLKEAFGPDMRLLAAYGDTGGDTEMLAMAEQPHFRVFTGRP
jgi:phosphatidylglycerophosphatase C